MFIIVAIALLLVELEIFAVAALKSGRKSWLQVHDAKGTVIYETDGANLSDFNKYYFEKTFGPFDQYDVRLVTRDQPFPFRAWFVAAVGIPIGLILLFAFVIRAYLTLFHADEVKRQAQPGQDSAESESAFEKTVNSISRFNIFIIGFLVLLGVLAYWVIPNLLGDLGRAGIDTLIRFKWVVLGAVVVFVGIAMWIIFLRYLLAKKTIESRTEVDKYRTKLEIEQQFKERMQLEYNSGGQKDTPLVDWEPEQEEPLTQKNG